jgi:hypothetical protein
MKIYSPYPQEQIKLIIISTSLPEIKKKQVTWYKDEITEVVDDTKDRLTIIKIKTG